MPQNTPPKRMTNFGPYLSTNHPSTGTSHVSNRTKSVNANWIDARSHLNAFWISGTKKVQPYCRLAIITMQAMPRTSWVQRNVSETRPAGLAAGVMRVGIKSLPDRSLCGAVLVYLMPTPCRTRGHASIFEAGQL